MKKYSVILVSLVVMALIAYKVTRPKQPPKIAVVQEKKGPIIHAVYGLGTVTPHRIYQLKVAVPSQLEEIYVEEGRAISKGSPLVRTETIFRAPFSGTITSLPYKTGEMVFPQTSILTLTDLSNLYVVVSLEQEAALLVKKGQSVIVSFENMRDARFTGHVTAIFSNDTQFLVHVEGITFPPNILPGMTCDVAIEISKKTQ
jgi:multidrug efflux pump subunit AcrA (membrane-fusion protein)